jgi:DNA processing protein
MVVPGPVTSAMSAGCHQMLSEPGGGALLVTRWEDVLSVVGAIGEVLPDFGWESHPAGDVRDDLERLEPASRRVFDALLVRRYLDANAISRRSGVDVLDVVRALPALVLTELAEHGPSGYRVAERVRKAG